MFGRCSQMPAAKGGLTSAWQMLPPPVSPPLSIVLHSGTIVRACRETTLLSQLLSLRPTDKCLDQEGHT